MRVGLLGIRTKAMALVGGVMSLLTLNLASRAEAVQDPKFEALQGEATKSFREVVTPFVENYCTRCHGQERQKGGINLAPALKKPGESASSQRWKQAVAVVRSHDMPPEESNKQPTDEERQKFLEGVAKIKFLSAKDPGAFVIRRLTKMEYANTLHDLLGVDPAIAAELPDEVFGEGYLNTLSPMQSEQYLAIANDALDRSFGAKGSPTKMQKQLFGKTPAREADERVSARNVARSLARKAYRRPASEEELDVLMRVFDLARNNDLSYADALRLALKAILVSPQFLFITPATHVESTGQPIVPLDDYQLASRLSYFLWATMPDAELSGLADRGRLHEPEVLKAQVKRLLEDQRSRALFDGFAAQWLEVGGLKTKTFDAAKFPEMTGAMRAAMYDEARLFFENVLHEDRSIMTLVDADYTILNGTVAELYGLDKKVTGSRWRKVKLTDANRGGVLGMPAVLAVTSFPTRTSPVKRGVWVLEQVLGELIPPPPPNVPALEKQDAKAIENLTMRQRTELHQKDPACANCHKILDPIGFGLENFDAIGRWREKDDSGGAIDAEGKLPGGKHFSAPKELKAIIAARKDDFARNFTRKLLAYALCRQLEGYDEIVVDHLLEDICKDGYRIQTLIAGIVTSYPFTNRKVQDQLLTSSHEK